MLLKEKTQRELFIQHSKAPDSNRRINGVWSTAYMSMTQFIMSIGLTFYIVVGLYFEEKSLIKHFGDTYLDYKKRVPGVIPFWPTH